MLTFKKFKPACENAYPFGWTVAERMLDFVVMSTEGPSGPKKINLRRPDIMAAVQAQVLSHYRRRWWSGFVQMGTFCRLAI